MRSLLFLLIILLLLPLQACKHGAASLPELAAGLFESLQDNSKKGFFKTVPTLQEYEAAYTNFYFNKYPDKSELRKEAKDKAASLHLNMSTSFTALVAEAKEKPIDWANTKIRDLKYSIKDRKEGFQEAKVRMILETGIDKNVVLFDAIRVEKQWFVVDNLRWEE